MLCFEVSPEWFWSKYNVCYMLYSEKLKDEFILEGWEVYEGSNYITAKTILHIFTD